VSTVRGEGRSFALLTKDATSYSIAVCHGNVKPFSRAKDEKKKGVPKAAELVRPNVRQVANGKQLQNRPNQAHL